MTKTLPDLASWPQLHWDQWNDTANTLHMFMQIVGKTRLALTALQNHWWNTTFYVTSRGLSTSAMPAAGGMLIDIEFDFLAHEVICRTSREDIGRIALRPMAVARFYEEFMKTLSSLGVFVQIDPIPVEVANPIRCDIDVTHCAYDPEATRRFWHSLRIADVLLKRFSTAFYGKISPVHFFWGSFDLAVTRFNGKRSPETFSDAIQAEAYSHEVISSGFWPGNGGYGQAAFYCYAAPVPAGLHNATIPGRGQFIPTLGEFVLNYEEARLSSDPVDTVLGFLEETYAAAAAAAKWDRSNLDRDDDVARTVRVKNPQSSRVST